MAVKRVLQFKDLGETIQKNGIEAKVKNIIHKKTGNSISTHAKYLK